MSSTSTFTVSADGGLIKSTKMGRTTLLTLNANTGELKRSQNLTFRIADGSNRDIDPTAIGMATARVLAVQPSTQDNFGDQNSGGVTVTINGADQGVVLKGGAFLFMVECNVTSLNVANGSGSEVSVDVLLAGE